MAKSPVRPRGDKTSRENLTRRRAHVIEHIANGLSDSDICTREKIERTTLWRDLAAIHDDLTTRAAHITDAALMKLIARYERIYDEAMACHFQERANEEKWLGLTDNYDRIMQQPAMDGGSIEESKPPPARFAKGQYLQVAMVALKELAKLTGHEGTQKIDLALSGKGGGAVEVKHVYEHERPQHVFDILAEAGVIALNAGTTGTGDEGSLN